LRFCVSPYLQFITHIYIYNSSGDTRDLHSLPTRRSSDLVFAEATDPLGGLRVEPGAGAAGGLGFALLLLGGTVESGVARVLSAVDLDGLAAGADLLITGEGSFDFQSLRGKLPHGVAQVAAAHGVPCVVTAGVASVDPDEAAAAGVTATYSLVESAGSKE